MNNKRKKISTRESIQKVQNMKKKVFRKQWQRPCQNEKSGRDSQFKEPPVI